VANLNLTGLEEFHIDGQSGDAVASMLYRDYLRPDGEWLPMTKGGPRESRSVNLSAAGQHRAVSSTSRSVCRSPKNPPTWPMVTQPPTWAAWDFNLKWNMAGCTTCSIIRSLIRDASVPPEQHHVSRSWYPLHRELHAGPSATMKWCMARAILLNKMPAMTARVRQCARNLLPFMWTHPARNHLHGHGVRSAGRMGMSGGS